MTSKHIALVISSLQAGGAERVLSKLANHWVNAGYQISLITLAPLDEKPFYPLSQKINFIQLDQSESGKASFLIRLKNIVTRFLCVRKCFQELRPDLILSFIDIMNITTLLATKGLKIPVIVAERTNPKYYHLPSIYTFMRMWVYPWAFKVIVQTQSAADYFSRTLQNKIAIIPNAVTLPEKVKTSVQIQKPVQNIVSVGRLIFSKGFKDLITSFAAVTLSHPNLKLSIYGEGRERQNLEMLIQSLNLQDKVHLPGNMENISKVLSQADLFVFPSHFEGFPNALCEAMAIGLPVIASSCSGNIDIIKDRVNGRLFPVGNVLTLTTLMTELIDNPDQRLLLSQEAFKLTSQFNEKKILKMWEAVIKEAINYTKA